MTHILVTGGTGGLGRELVTQLKRSGHRVRVMSRRARLMAPDLTRPRPGDLPCACV